MKALKTAPFAALILMIAACSPPSPTANPSPDAPQSPASESPASPTLEQAVSCQDERGEAQAKRLVERCIAVSPATRPPCNVANPCALIEDEIKRGCDVFGPAEKPAECAA